jgi:transposase
MTASTSADSSPVGVTNPLPVPTSFVGIDVAKDKWDVHLLHQNKSLSVPADDGGLQQLLDFLPQPGACLVVLEASGGYEAELLYELQSLGHLVAKVNPRQVRDFARACGQLAKTDALDARLLALFAEKMEPVPSEQVSRQRREMMALVERRRQLLKMRVMESNRLPQTRVKQAKNSVEQMLKALDRQVREIEREIARLLETNDEWKPKIELLTSVPGIGKASAAMLVSELPELGNANRQEIAALTGVAPINRDSGAMRGKRATVGGRKHVRSALFMAVVSAIKSNPVIREFSRRLASKGKSFKQRVIACMRKLLVILNTILKTKQPWCDKMEVT